ALQRLSGQSLAAYARTRLFQPLNISNYDWIKDSNNINYGAYGVYLTPRDLAKIGQLMLQNGQWNSVQVVSASWINDSVTKQIENSSATTANYDYGFYWWLIPELNAFTAWGHGGNFVTVMPDKQLVVVLTSFPNSGNNVGTHLDEFLPVLRRLYNGAN
ncbi:MAG: serine hydrolase, partial [Gammaproteobacteria bacterium]|nr:serine hydrolase [Gammaproteobacteria bacterium]